MLNIMRFTTNYILKCIYKIYEYCKNDKRSSLHYFFSLALYVIAFLATGVVYLYTKTQNKCPSQISSTNIHNLQVMLMHCGILRDNIVLLKNLLKDNNVKAVDTIALIFKQHNEAKYKRVELYITITSRQLRKILISNTAHLINAIRIASILLICLTALSTLLLGAIFIAILVSQIIADMNHRQLQGNNYNDVIIKLSIENPCASNARLISVYLSEYKFKSYLINKDLCYGHLLAIYSLLETKERVSIFCAARRQANISQCLLQDTLIKYTAHVSTNVVRSLITQALMLMNNSNLILSITYCVVVTSCIITGLVLCSLGRYREYKNVERYYNLNILLPALVKAAAGCKDSRIIHDAIIISATKMGVYSAVSMAHHDRCGTHKVPDGIQQSLKSCVYKDYVVHNLYIAQYLRYHAYYVDRLQSSSNYRLNFLSGGAFNATLLIDSAVGTTKVYGSSFMPMSAAIFSICAVLYIFTYISSAFFLSKGQAYLDNYAKNSEVILTQIIEPINGISSSPDKGVLSIPKMSHTAAEILYKLANSHNLGIENCANPINCALLAMALYKNNKHNIIMAEHCENKTKCYSDITRFSIIILAHVLQPIGLDLAILIPLTIISLICIGLYTHLSINEMESAFIQKTAKLSKKIDDLCTTINIDHGSITAVENTTAMRAI